MIEYSLGWVQFITALWLGGILVGLVIVGILLRSLVQNGALLAENALKVIAVLSRIVGGIMGSVGVLVLLIILWPEGSDWIVNTYLAKTSIWQLEFQTWLTQSISDPRAASAAGLIIKSFQFGGVALGFVLGNITASLFSWLLGEAFHRDVCEHERHKKAEVRIPEKEPVLPRRPVRVDADAPREKKGK